MRIKIFHWTISLLGVFGAAITTCTPCFAASMGQKTLSAEATWEAHVGQYRKGHNLGIAPILSTGLWQVEVPNQNGTQVVASQSYGVTVQYSYHFQLYNGIGYFLGSSFGYLQEMGRHTDEGFRPTSTWQLPGLQAGLSLSVTPRIRIATGADIHMERMEAFTVRENGADTKIYATLRTWPDRFVMVDLFYQLRMAVRLEAHQRTLGYQPPRNSAGKPTDISLHKEDRWLGLGLVFHDL